MSFDDSLNLLPSLAKSWEISHDGCRYIFHLRDNVFHNDKCFENETRKLIADDVVYSLQRLADEKLPHQVDG